MKISSTLFPEAVLLDLGVMTREAAVDRLISTLTARRSVDVRAACSRLAAAGGGVLAAVGNCGVAVPHAATNAVRQLAMAIGTSREGVAWDKSGGRANLIVAVLYPPEAQAFHLRLLARLARLLQSEKLAATLVAATTPAEVIGRIADAEAELGEIPPAEGLPSFCVLGAGNGGMAMAGHLALNGCKVNLYNRSPERLVPIRERGGLDVSGEIEGFAALNKVSSEPAEALEGVDVVMVVTPATAHRFLAAVMAPHLRDGQVIVLNPGRTGGALEVVQVLRECKCKARPYVAEAQTLLYASRITNPGQVRIFGIKNSVPMATLPAYDVVDVLPVIRKVLPQFVPGDNVLKTSMDNIGAVFHPAITVLNAGRIEDTHGEFQYYVEGVTPAVAAVLEAVDRERVGVARALGIRANTAREWLYLAYNAAGKTLIDAMRANHGYSGIKAPGTIQHRYISEDVPTSLVPIASIGQMLGVPTPATRAVIELASVMHGVDYWREGRTVERLGIAGMSVRDLQLLVAGADVSAAVPVAVQLESGGRLSGVSSVFDQPPAAV